jgi:OmpA-OmpF porin, OOP family
MNLVRVLVALFALAIATRAGAAEVKHTVYFEHGTAKLNDTVPDLLKMVIDYIKISKTTTVALVGHCDTSEQPPTILSRYRAKAVADALRRLGLPDTIAITWEGAGAQNPAVASGPNIKEPLNRRVTVSY